MSRYEVAVLIQSPRKLYMALELLKQLGLHFVVCAPDDPACINADVLLVTENETPPSVDQRVVIVDDDPETTGLDIMLRLRKVVHPSHIIVGVDPGMRFGLALVMDGQVITMGAASMPINAVDMTLRWIRWSFRRFPMVSPIIRVGTGSRLYAVLYTRGLFQRYPGLHTEFVDERHTTHLNTSVSDESAAVMIAARCGQVVSRSDLVLELKREYIHDIKRIFLQLNKRCISNEDAVAVIRGDFMLEDLL